MEPLQLMALPTKILPPIFFIEFTRTRGLFPRVRIIFFKKDRFTSNFPIEQ